MHPLIYWFVLTYCVVHTTQMIGMQGGGPPYRRPTNSTKDPAVLPNDPLKHDVEKPKENPIVIDGRTSSNKTALIDQKSKQSNSSVAANVTSVNKNQGLVNNHAAKDNENVEIDSGAITRGFLVIMGIGLLFLSYVAIKTCRRKTPNKSQVMVRKYGVRTNRTDLEMEPLPLSDDDEDDTVFDLAASRTNLR